MRTTRLDRLFGDEPTHDPAVRWGRRIGSAVGLSIFPVFVWIVIDGFTRIL